MTFFDKPVYAQKHPDFGFQIGSCFESEYVEVYPGAWGLEPPKLRALENNPG